jgi:hypothetical protein
MAAYQSLGASSGDWWSAVLENSLWHMSRTG